MPKKTVLVLTGGGHVHFGPGIKRFVEGSRERRWRALGSLYGWKGVITDDLVDFSYLSERELSKMEYVGGSPLFSSRTKPGGKDSEIIRNTIRKHGITDVVAFGGDDTISVDPGVPVVGWPKTMDNNHGPAPKDRITLFPGTYFDIGYPTAIDFAGKQVAYAQANAQTNSSVHVVVTFGRDQDFVGVGAAAYGCADMMLPGESNIYFSDFYKRLVEACEKNADTYKCNPFAVIVIPEGVNRGDAQGLLEGYAPKELVEYGMNNVSKDDFGHPKLKPELIALMFTDAIEKRSKQDGGRIIKKVTPRVLSYHLRDGPGTEIDRRMGAQTAEKCLQLIEEGNTGQMATVTWDGKDFGTGSVQIPRNDDDKQRYVKQTDFFDYEGTWKPTGDFFGYAAPFMGKPPSREDLLYNSQFYVKARPI